MTVHRLLSIIAVVMLILLLIAVRFFETTLFPEPLYDYFHTDFQLLAVPSGKAGVILAVTALRYLVNTVLSLGVLWFIYKKRTFIIASLWVYLFAFVILLITMAVCLFIDGESAKMILFYARRFLIHPILLFILVAGFYYLRNKELR
jgi:exosortase F-associated protein